MGYIEERAAREARAARLTPRVTSHEGQLAFVHTARDGRQVFQAPQRLQFMSLGSSPTIVRVYATHPHDHREVVAVDIPLVRVDVDAASVQRYGSGLERVEGVGIFRLPDGQEASHWVRGFRPTAATAVRQAEIAELRDAERVQQAALRAQLAAIPLAELLSPRAQGLMRRNSWGLQPGPVREVRNELSRALQVRGLSAYEAGQMARERVE